MQNIDRVSCYAAQRNINSEERTFEEGASWMTAAQRRRVRHKDGSPKTHSHEGLLVYEGDKVRRLPCQRCSPSPRQQRRVGGTS